MNLREVTALLPPDIFGMRNVATKLLGSERPEKTLELMSNSFTNYRTTYAHEGIHVLSSKKIGLWHNGPCPLKVHIWRDVGVFLVPSARIISLEMDTFVGE